MTSAMTDAQKLMKSCAYCDARAICLRISKRERFTTFLPVCGAHLREVETRWRATAALLTLSLLCACPAPPAPADGGADLVQLDQAEPACPSSKRCGQNSDCYPPPGQLCAGGCCVSPLAGPDAGAR